MAVAIIGKMLIYNCFNRKLGKIKNYFVRIINFGKSCSIILQLLQLLGDLVILFMYSTWLLCSPLAQGNFKYALYLLLVKDSNKQSSPLMFFFPVFFAVTKAAVLLRIGAQMLIRDYEERKGKAGKERVYVSLRTIDKISGVYRYRMENKGWE